MTGRAASGRIRISGGNLRNSRLDVPDLPGLRPTPERVRETLFNWLQPVINGARCLDLYAGTGALGIEALSRGASCVRFVEREPRLAAALRANLVRLKVENPEVAADDAARLVSQAPAGKPYDVVFLDPPFALEAWTSIAAQLEKAGWLAGHAWIYVERARHTPVEMPANWLAHREGVAGEVAYTLYRRHPVDPLS
ncbi:16S rRNA (guanine966-N2)-methyltransferase [Luteibacter sp. Sphag1AF]|uniref:16S rRNA (guanine(966)-N(2))-methyltransferase RsmD n=1 Tax=Luteibacter sp. Sphag1AF TaxID=2587031 RepID=UPI0016198C63|nr:16S rRNA (guanine(966)-N(2))-methyltransferase RsmD [Luteibacter sp. Sphag1AF]MBB3225629.1 16S rRNA (guanine966-N2)-methyltransferase [Luteibacter sp. Sphag1AF]